MNELAEKNGFSISYLIKQFKNYYGVTPGEYIYRRRLAKVKKLLTVEGNTLDFIAQECGFYDSSHLIHRFTAAESITPSEYRQEMIK